MKKLLSVLSIMLIVASGIVYAQGFTNDSFRGTYSGIVTNEGANTVMVGTFTADGNGIWNSSAKISLPAPLGQRQIFDITMTGGTYTVNADGTLFLTASFTIPNGVEVDAEMDGVIWKTEIIGGIPIVTELVGFGRGGELPLLKPGGIVKYEARRLSD